MEAIILALQEEKKEAARLITRYKSELSKLPKGSFFVRTFGKNRYGYVTYSKQGVVKQNYLGPMNDEQISEYREKISRKKKVQELAKMAQKQYTFLEKALRHAG